MNVTNMINKVLNDYKNIHLAVNNSIKYRFLYNGYPTDIFYTTTDGLQNQLLIAITVNDTTYLSTLYFSKNSNNEFYMNFYLPPELYQNVKFTLLLVNGKCSTTPYFQQMEQSIINNVPVASNHRNNINQGNLHHYHENTDNPFFETIVRTPMSDKMRDKINKKYDNVVAKQIFKYCGNTKTLRFTADITRSKDILAFINRPT